MDLLINHLAGWIGLRISYRPPRSQAENDASMRVWEVLDVDVETATILAETLELRFEDGRLCISEACSGRYDLIELISTALLSVWKFVQWSESRFLTVGVSARRVVAALLTGLEDLVDLIRADSSCSHFYINGFARLRGDRKTFLVVCC